MLGGSTQNTATDGQSSVPIKLYLQEQVGCQIRHTDHSLSIPGLKKENRHEKQRLQGMSNGAVTLENRARDVKIGRAHV